MKPYNDLAIISLFIKRKKFISHLFVYLLDSRVILDTQASKSPAARANILPRSTGKPKQRNAKNRLHTIQQLWQNISI